MEALPGPKVEDPVNHRMDMEEDGQGKEEEATRQSILVSPD